MRGSHHQRQHSRTATTSELVTCPPNKARVSCKFDVVLHPREMFYWQPKACLRNVRPCGLHYDTPCQDYYDGFGRPCLQLEVGGFLATLNYESLCYLHSFVNIDKHHSLTICSPNTDLLSPAFRRRFACPLMVGHDERGLSLAQMGF